MKVFALFFSLYFLSLTLIPCGDAHDTDLDEEFHTTFIASEHSDHHHEAESCSPLCACQCCSIHINIETHDIQLVLTQLSFQIKAPQELGTPKEAHIQFWQPPKV